MQHTVHTLAEEVEPAALLWVFCASKVKLTLPLPIWKSFEDRRSSGRRLLSEVIAGERSDQSLFALHSYVQRSTYFPKLAAKTLNRADSADNQIEEINGKSDEYTSSERQFTDVDAGTCGRGHCGIIAAKQKAVRCL